MNSREVGAVIGTDGSVLYWHEPQDRTVVSLPDSQDLWQVLWDNRENLLGFAHSHPGIGFPAPSWTDITTFAAIEAGLGKRLIWWITSGDVCTAFKWQSANPKLTTSSYTEWSEALEPLSWLEELRMKSQHVRGVPVHAAMYDETSYKGEQHGSE